MPCISLSTSAVKKLLADPKLHQRQTGESGRRVPYLGYFRRSYSTSHDGATAEHGDGFMLMTIDPTDEKETKGIVLRSVAVADGIDILVGGDASTMSEGFIIGWSKWKYTRETAASHHEADDLTR